METFTYFCDVAIKPKEPMDYHKLTSWTKVFSYRQKVFLLIIGGVIVGLGLLFLYLLRMHTYLVGDDPAACVNCHITNGNIVSHYAFKGMDGMKHVAYFVSHSERQAIMAEDASAEVIMDNCIRCHKQLNTEFVKTGRIDYMEAKRGEGLACWDCHRNVPHGGMNTLTSTPNAETQVPIPPSPVPEWLQKALR